MARAPQAGAGSGNRPGPELCPTRAIQDGAIAQGSCIRCGRCAAAGYEFRSAVATAATAEELRWAAGRPTAAAPRRRSEAPFRRSVHVFLVDAGSCNACNLEVLALANPYYDSQRLGIFLTNSPRHADLLVVVGIPTRELEAPLRRAYDALPAPKLVVAVGACALDGGIFRGAPGTVGPLRDLLPVDVFVPGCPPAPVAVLAGILRAIGAEAPGTAAP